MSQGLPKSRGLLNGPSRAYSTQKGKQLEVLQKKTDVKNIYVYTEQ